MTTGSRALRICLIGSSRFPVKEPFAGGLEAHTHALARELDRRGHEVSLFAAAGSDPSLNVSELPCAVFEPNEAARLDVAAPPDQWMDEHHAYLTLMLDLMRVSRGSFDLIHNNSLHHLPIAMSKALDIPVITTLHTPPIPWLVSAIQFAGPNCHFLSVSETTAAAWSEIVASTPVRNGVDLAQWSLGHGGGPALWSGRIVPEKAPHQALQAARLAAMPIRIAGKIIDHSYFATQIEPLLGNGAEYVGHLGSHQLRQLVQDATVAVVTPAWEEPYGLVAAEAMACGTPVAAFARGAMVELIDDSCGVLAIPDDPTSLATAMVTAAKLDRREVRRTAERTCSHDVMVDNYERFYRATLDKVNV